VCSHKYACLGIINAHLKDGRTRTGARLVGDADPDMFFLGKYGHLNDVQEYENAYLSVMRNFNRTNKVITIADYFGLKECEKSDLSKLPAWNKLFPWEIGSVIKKHRAYPGFVEENRKKRGGLVVGLNSHNLAEFLSSDQYFRSQARQFFTLATSIKENGLMRSNAADGDITATVLFSGDRYCWCIDGDGNHRAKIAASMNYISAPVRIVRTVNRDYVSVWPQVISGLFTEDNALAVFDKMFNAETFFAKPSWCSSCEDSPLN